MNLRGKKQPLTLPCLEKMSQISHLAPLNFSTIPVTCNPRDNVSVHREPLIKSSMAQYLQLLSQVTGDSICNLFKCFICQFGRFRSTIIKVSHYILRTSGFSRMDVFFKVRRGGGGRGHVRSKKICRFVCILNGIFWC